MHLAEVSTLEYLVPVISINGTIACCTTTGPRCDSWCIYLVLVLQLFTTCRVSSAGHVHLVAFFFCYCNGPFVSKVELSVVSVRIFRFLPAVGVS